MQLVSLLFRCINYDCKVVFKYTESVKILWRHLLKFALIVIFLFQYVGYQCLMSASIFYVIIISQLRKYNLKIFTTCFLHILIYDFVFRKVPAYLNVVDIAGLVKGASEGQGLGNAFLSHISACDAIFHLCRAFEDPDVTHVEGEVNPVRDLDIISEELRLKDEEKLMQNLDKLEKVVARGGDKKLKPEYDSMLKIKGVLVDEKKQLRFADWNAHDVSSEKFFYIFFYVMDFIF